MFTGALSATAKTWKPPKDALTDEWINKIRHIIQWNMTWQLKKKLN